jgi:hypothetical protein
MTAVIVFTAFVLFSWAQSFNKLKDNLWRPVVSKDTNAGHLFLGFVIFVLPLYIWLVVTVGWILPTIAIVLFSAINFGIAIHEIEAYGGLRTTRRDLVISVLFYVPMIFMLFQAVLTPAL